MAEFFRFQLDYILFFYGLVFQLLAAACFSFRKAGSRQPAWAWLGLFGILHGAKEWLDLAALDVGDGRIFPALRLALLALSFIALLEFARRTVRRLKGHAGGRLASPWLYALLLPLAGLGLLAGFPNGVNATVRYALGLAGALWAAWALSQWARQPLAVARGWLLSASLALGSYGIASGLVVPAAPFFPASILNQEAFFRASGMPIQLVRALLVCWLAFSIWGYAQRILASSTRLAPRKLQRHSVMTMAALAGVLGLGWALTEHLGHHYQQDLKNDTAGELNLLARLLDAELGPLAGAAGAMAAAPMVPGALEKPTAGMRELANEAMDRYRAATHASIAYLLDREGTVIATSNRDTPASPLGKNYRFRPYFQNALAGNPGRYFALGVTTGERGYYASHPVRNRQKEIVGVAVIKKTLDAIEQDLMKAYEYCFLIDPYGIAFLSSRQDLLFNSLWPLPAETRERLSSSRQFGDIRFIPLVQQEVVDGSWITLHGKKYLAGRRPVGDGWSFVVLRQEGTTILNRVLGIIITLLLSVLVLVYHVALQREFGTGARLKQQHRELAKLARALRTQAATDVLTGAFNRSKFNTVLAAELERARRYGTPFAIVMYDIDHFKRINDTHGHQAGDSVLVGLSKLVAGHIRKTDGLARWGGEEFMIIMPGCDTAEGVSLAEKIRSNLEQHDFGPAGKVTCSFGVAQYRPDDTAESLTGRADQALYKAKTLGRNRVETG